MQREIKFRAWDKKTKKMYTLITLQWLEVLYIGGIGDFRDVMYEVDDTVKLMQYTGLRDKNGVMIFEGDILCVYDEAVVPVTDEGQGPIEPCNHLVVVEMRHGVWGFEIPKADDGETGWFGLHYWNEEISSDGYEIIGNRFETPELLQD